MAYELRFKPRCRCGLIPCLCPETGSLDSEFLTVYPGWNVWDVWQVDDLPFSPSMIGVSRDRQLRIWVEDTVRLKAGGAVIADPIDLKGGQVEILNAAPSGLQIDQRKESVPGPVMTVKGKATLRTVRFFNRGARASLAWPHDESYLLEKTYIPSQTHPATSGPAPTTIPETVITDPITNIASNFGSFMLGVAPFAVAGGLLWFFQKDIFGNVRKLRKRRDSRSR